MASLNPVAFELLVEFFGSRSSVDDWFFIASFLVSTATALFVFAIPTIELVAPLALVVGVISLTSLVSVTALLSSLLVALAVAISLSERLD